MITRHAGQATAPHFRSPAAPPGRLPRSRLVEFERDSSLDLATRPEDHDGLEDHVRLYLREIGAVPLLLDLGYPLFVAYACVFCAAAFGAIFNPARIAIIPQLVVPERLAAANSTVAAPRAAMVRRAPIT